MAEPPQYRRPGSGENSGSLVLCSTMFWLVFCLRPCVDSLTAGFSVCALSSPSSSSPSFSSLFIDCLKVFGASAEWGWGAVHLAWNSSVIYFYRIRRCSHHLAPTEAIHVDRLICSACRLTLILRSGMFCVYVVWNSASYIKGSKSVSEFPQVTDSAEFECLSDMDAEVGWVSV